MCVGGIELARIGTYLHGQAEPQTKVASTQNKKEPQSFNGGDFWSNEEAIGSLTYSLP